MPIKPASERRLIGRKVDALDIPAEDERDGALRDRRGRRRHGLCAAEDSADPQWRERPFDRRFRRPERQGLYQQSRARGPVRHGSGLGDGVRGFLSGRHPRRRPGQGRLGRRATAQMSPSRMFSIMAAKQIADPKGGVLLVDDPGLDAAFRGAKSTLEQTYTTSSVLHFQLEPVNALAFEKDGVFEIHTGNQWQTLILPVLAKALRLPQEKIVMRTYHARRRLRPAPQRRLCRARRRSPPRLSASRSR